MVMLAEMPSGLGFTVVFLLCRQTQIVTYVDLIEKHYRGRRITSIIQPHFIPVYIFRQSEWPERILPNSDLDTGLRVNELSYWLLSFLNKMARNK